jgi:hypothetical protein
MTTYVLRNGRLMEKHQAPRRSVASVISDTMDALKHPGTGELIDSKAAFRAATRASGCLEVGNEPMRPQPRPEPRMSEIADDVKRSIAQLRSR